MRQYHSLLDDILSNGELRVDRTGVGTIGVFGRQLRFDLRETFPLVTTKKLFTKGIVHELLWFLRGESNIKYLVDNGVSIWTDWPLKHYNQSNNANMGKDEFETLIRDNVAFAKRWGELGPVYGVQWRKWAKSYWHEDGYMKVDRIDQINNVLRDLHNNPFSRRHIVTAWNPAEIDEIVSAGGLPPCHCLFQFYVSNNMELSSMLYQRSCDAFLGVPFNIASYALLTHMFAHVLGYKVGEFVHSYADLHIYTNHIDQVRIQLGREHKVEPTLWLNPDVKKLEDFTFNDIRFDNYNPHPAIKGAVAV